MSIDARDYQAPARCAAVSWYMGKLGPVQRVCGLPAPHGGGHALVSACGERLCTRAEVAEVRRRMVQRVVQVLRRPS